MPVDPQWYRKNWTLDIQDVSWVEHTEREVEFVISALGLRGGERILDLACGFGRHALGLAARGYSVVGVDLTREYIDEARKRAAAKGVKAEFVHADIRDVSFHEEFDAVLNLADGAIGYLENEEENLKIFDRIASALRPRGNHLMGVCNGAYAERYFPRRHWDAGSHALSLADFQWDREKRRMQYTSYSFPYGKPLPEPDPDITPGDMRLYTLEELRRILGERGLDVRQAYGDYDRGATASEDAFMLVVHSVKTADAGPKAD